LSERAPYDVDAEAEAKWLAVGRLPRHVDGLFHGPAARMLPQTFDDLRKPRKEIERIAERHGARNVRVFRSVGRGAAVPGSDVNFLVDFDPDRTVLDLSALILELQAALGCEDDLKWLTRDGRAAEPIRREAIAL
jgi:predicted nucleotidyltransferase